MSKYNIGAMIGSLAILAQSGASDAVGINNADLLLTRGDKPWTGADRPTVVRCLEQFIFGGMDAQGLGAIQVPAEFAAAVVYAVVSPVNARAACYWLPSRNSAESELLGEVDNVTPARLVAMVTCLYGENQGQATPMKEMFEKAISREVTKLQKATG